MNRRALLRGLALLWTAGQDAGAVSFRTFDPRSMAMGGAGVASGTSANASFYNLTLLAAARDGEDFSLELPVVGARLTDPDQFINSLDDYQRAHYSDALSGAIDQHHGGDALGGQGGGDQRRPQHGERSQQPVRQGPAGGCQCGHGDRRPSRRWGAALFLNSRA